MAAGAALPPCGVAGVLLPGGAARGRRLRVRGVLRDCDGACVSDCRVQLVDGSRTGYPRRRRATVGHAVGWPWPSLRHGAGTALTSAEFKITLAAGCAAVAGPIGAVVPNGTAAGDELRCWGPRCRAANKRNGGLPEAPLGEPRRPSMHGKAKLDQRRDAGANSSCTEGQHVAAPHSWPGTQAARRRKRAAIGAR